MYLLGSGYLNNKLSQDTSKAQTLLSEAAAPGYSEARCLTAWNNFVSRLDHAYVPALFISGLDESEEAKIYLACSHLVRVYAGNEGTKNELTDAIKIISALQSHSKVHHEFYFMLAMFCLNKRFSRLDSISLMGKAAKGGNINANLWLAEEDLKNGFKEKAEAFFKQSLVLAKSVDLANDSDALTTLTKERIQVIRSKYAPSVSLFDRKSTPEIPDTFHDGNKNL